MLKIEDFHGVKVIIAVPWLEDGIQRRGQTYKAHKGHSEKVAAYPEPSSIVEKTMASLTDAINDLNGINHRMNADRAKIYIRALDKYEPELNRDVVGAYLAASLGWDTRHVGDVEALINILNSDKYFEGD